MIKVTIKLPSPYLPLHESQSETSSTAGNGGVGKRKDSKKKTSRSSATAHTTASRGPEPAHYQSCMIMLEHATLGKAPLHTYQPITDLYLKTHYNDRQHPCPPQYSKPQSQPAMGHRPTPQTTVTGRLPAALYSVDMSSFFETQISGDHKCCILQYTALVSLYLLPLKRNLPDKYATTCSFCNFFPRNPVHTEN